jgi:acyl-CoA dehydrogenase
LPWDFSTEPEFQKKLDWMSAFVRERIWPLETLLEELGWDGLTRALKPLKDEVKEQGLWAAHLDPELGGQGFGQVKLGFMHEILGT